MADGYFYLVCIILAGFPFHISGRGGNGPPPMGGDSRGGTESGRGGNGA